MDFIAQKKLYAARSRWSRLQAKYEALLKQRDLETRSEEQIRLDDLIAELEPQIDQVEQDMARLDGNNQSSSQVISSTYAPAKVQPGDPGPIFISYRRNDLAAVNNITRALQDAGLPVWFDQSSICAGDDWLNLVRTNIETCTLFLAVLSQNTLVDESEATREWNLALERQERVSKQSAFLIPVVIDDVGPGAPFVPAEFWRKQVLHCADGIMSSESVDQIKQKFELRTKHLARQ